MVVVSSGGGVAFGLLAAIVTLTPKIFRARSNVRTYVQVRGFLSLFITERRHVMTKGSFGF